MTCTASPKCRSRCVQPSYDFATAAMIFALPDRLMYRAILEERVSHVSCHLSMSLDGFIVGRNQSVEDPVGVGGLRLHEWHHRAGDSGYEADVKPNEWLMGPKDAYVMGRNMFGPIRGEWSGNWRGWWGDEPSYHAPVFVLTHYAHDPIEMSGGTTFFFVTSGLDDALEAGACRRRQRHGRHRRRRVDGSSSSDRRRPR